MKNLLTSLLSVFCFFIGNEINAQVNKMFSTNNVTIIDKSLFKPDGSSAGNAAVSGVQLHTDYPSFPSGWYWIKTASMPSALQMYVDMTEDGGGYDFYIITAGPAVTLITETNGGTPLGLDLVMPRSKGHWKAMSNAVLAAIAANKNGGAGYASFFQTTYGIYRTTNAGNGGGNYTSKIMRHSSYGGSTNAADSS